MSYGVRVLGDISAKTLLICWERERVSEIKRDREIYREKQRGLQKEIERKTNRDRDRH